MRRGLRIVFAVWVALTLVVAPLEAARAAPCNDAGMRVSMSETQHHASADHASPHAAAETVTPAKADHAPLHCGAAHACCVSSCATPLMAVTGADPVGTVPTVVPRLVEQRLPEGISSRPPFDPPRTAI